MNRKIALLSNINMNPLLRMLKSTAGLEVYETEGYGNELGLLLNPDSSYHAFGPEAVFFWMDLPELLGQAPEPAAAGERIGQWFAALEAGLEEGGSYFISDAFLWGAETAVGSAPFIREEIERIWMQELEKICRKHGNVYPLEYRSIIEELGTAKAFSKKMWYMGKIAHTQAAMDKLQEAVLHKLDLLYRMPKKVLVLDLDNTLWGGLAGEHDVEPVVLSEEHKGQAYKNMQRVILQMKQKGVILAIASKNNEEDAMEILKKHPHMLLRPEDFVSRKINWEPKADNIRQMAEELNLGLDSFVFFDDSEAEREQIRQMLPEIAVPQFPRKAEELAPAMLEIYRKYFEKLKVTEEDLVKTRMYEENTRRHAFQQRMKGYYDAFLKQLQIRIVEEDPKENENRLLELVNKTNQFNLTTKRYEPALISAILKDKAKRVHLYRAVDKFGDNGIIGVLILDISGEAAVIEEFTLSCRVMGRQIEDYIIHRAEQEAQKLGFRAMEALYIPTAKNKPVEGLYERLGYEVIRQEEGRKTYRMPLEEIPERKYYIREEREENAAEGANQTWKKK